ncbi:MAG TPA: isoleucine--tRNA ligase [Acidimicrobiales bacterium]|nr:isoleucine--tRNA ligase [Acidimicrobiales bacterium]
MPPYPDVPRQPDLPGLEQRILDFWAEDDTFRASVEQRAAGDNEFVFYDGPPFANGLPHYGHLLTGYVKDAVPRYHTMKGRRVERRFGWDCHGLPAEMEAEKELGISGHVDITRYGIDRFNEACHTSVLRYTREWQAYVTRQARWVDFDHDYKTLDLTYMESVLWAFKQLWEKGLIYEGYKVLPYCWECETPLSNFETRLDDAYRPRVDPAVTVRFRLDTGEDLLVWTTTPWTLPSNLALAVGPDIDYSVFEEEGGRRVLVGAATAGRYDAELAGATPAGTVKGADLVGRGYTPLFPFFSDTPNAFRVLGADFVSTEEGTGTVHIAPGFGEDDQRVCETNGIPLVVPVDIHARFTAEVPPYEGLQVFDANHRIVADLAAAGALVQEERYEHSYPHCWRTDTPLVYRAISSWFVEVTAIKQRALELNQDITWVPEHIRDGAFGKWLENARDWSISRNRFWGSPIPVWKSDDPAFPRVDVYGSLDELERDFGVRPGDLHRPAIDNLSRPNPDDPSGKATMRRVEEVLDCWFESGSMPYAQVHYPFDKQEWFDSHFPADFIVEYVGQTRAWFYNLHVLATALFDKAPFRACVVHGVILGDDGRKASKRLRNYVDPEEMFATYGADAVRWFLLSSPVLRGQDLIFTRSGVEEAVRQVLHPVWNAWHFFALYANTEHRQAAFRADAPGVLDRYALAKSRQLVDDVTARMDAYDIAGACAAITSFLDALTNWYIRRSRDRFWAGDADAFDTLATVLEVLTKTAAPLLPMLCEDVFRGLTGRRSVHLEDWVDGGSLPADAGLVAAMDRVREVCSAAHAIRKAGGLRARLPLASLTVAAADAAVLEPYRSLIADELNVKDVLLTTDVGAVGELRLQVVPAVLGPRVGAEVQKIIRAVREGRWERTSSGAVEVAGRVLADDEYTLRLVPRDEATARALPGTGGIVALDVVLTPELEAEGLARDVVRLGNQARKDAGLHVSDRIGMVLGAPEDVAAAVETHRDEVMAQTLAVDLVVLVLPAGGDGVAYALADGRAVHIAVERTAPAGV